MRSHRFSAAMLICAVLAIICYAAFFSRDSVAANARKGRSDAEAALARNDTHFTRGGRVMSDMADLYPGLINCHIGSSVLVSDVVSDNETEKADKIADTYAENYNQVILKGYPQSARQNCR
jgi:hypothetical protein